MKTCPNCGSKMEADVNFCTVCGTNIKDVPLDGAQPVQPASHPVNPQPVQEPAQPTQQQPAQSVQSTASNEVQPEQNNAQTQNSQPQSSQQPQQINDTFSKVSSQITTAVKNFDKESLWKWFVTSWKTPSAEQHGEKWYGVATLLVEIILFTIGLTAGSKRFAMDQVPAEYRSELGSRISSVIHTFGFDIFLTLVVLCAGIIVSSYLSSKFAHGTTVSFLQYTNKVVQMSNLSAIIVIVMSLLLFFDIKGTIAVTSLLMSFTVLLFLIAAGFCIKDGPKTARDPFYGVILYIILTAIVVIIVFAIFGNQISTQTQQMFNSNFGQLFD